MTERNFSETFNFWYGVVTSVDDPDQDGRCQVRIHSRHDDENACPIEKLPWSKPLHPIHSSGHNKIGMSPVGAIVGSTAFGFFLDKDHQYPFHLGFIAKAGDADSGSSSNGSETLIEGTNSNPPGSRLANNAFITRKGQNIKIDDQTKITYPQYSPPQQKDSDGKDIVQMAIANTKYANNPTIGSILKPAGSVLTQLQQVDPQNLNGILKQAIPSFIKIADIQSFSSAGGATQVLGQALGMALNAISGSVGQATVVNSLGAMASQGQLSQTASTALYLAITSLGATISTTDSVGAVIVQSLNDLIQLLTPLLQNGTLTLAQFEALIAQFLAEIQNNGSQATIGVQPSNILNELASVLPTLASPINTTLDIHLPKSVLDIKSVSNTIQAFAMSMAYVKAPTSGKKYWATKAVQQSSEALNTNIAAALSQIQGVAPAAIKALSSLM